MPALLDLHTQAEAALERELAGMAAVWGDAETSVSLMASSDVPLLDNLEALQARLRGNPSDAESNAYDAIDCKLSVLQGAGPRRPLGQ